LNGGAAHQFLKKAKIGRACIGTQKEPLPRFPSREMPRHKQNLNAQAHAISPWRQNAL